tara:strand:- start:117 stop:1157 length:1041 start_codon:yes stop_codon:yes gene_type:complete
MLEQAIIDAEQLKETAKATAEEAIVEKYQHEVKEAIDKILEQEELDLGEDTETAGMVIDPEGNLEIIEDLPAAQTADMEEVVEIDLNKLEEMMAEELEEGELDPADMLQREEVAEELEALTEDEEEVDLEESDLIELAEEELEEEIELDEENLAAIIAEMLGSETEELEESDVVEPSIEEEETIEALPAPKRDEKARKLAQESRLLNNKNKQLLKEQKELNNKARLLQEKVDKYGTVINTLKNKLNESNLTNARLLYQNRILSSVSLNERQKDKIVEAISNATTVEEAKLIFETLQSAVGSLKNTKTSESLNEVVTRSSSAFIPRKEVKPKTDAFSERMRRLAGLK